MLEDTFTVVKRHGNGSRIKDLFSIIPNEDDSQAEIDSLERDYDYFHYIKQLPGEEYELTVPGLRLVRTGEICGTTSVRFPNWDSAKEAYLDFRETEEKLSEKSLLEISVDDTKLRLVSYEDFNPDSIPTDRVYEVPIVIKNHLNACSTPTYDNTISEPGWGEKIFSFIEDYVTQTDLIDELGIESLTDLTPKQAMELSNRIVVNLTKYNYDQRNAEEANTVSDKSTVLELLEDGLINKGKNGSWSGNGVCRNFAAMVKVIFQAIKRNQTTINKLTNTYCFFGAGKEYAPKRDYENMSKPREIEHAWNPFITIMNNGAIDLTITDSTWGKVDEEKNGLKKIDFTITRSEPLVRKIIYKGEVQIEEILDYYTLLLNNLGMTGGHSTEEEERRAYATSLVSILSKYPGYRDVSPLISEFIATEYQDIKDLRDSEFMSLWNISKNLTLPLDKILTNYIDHIKHNNNPSFFVFEDPGLQMKVVEELERTPLVGREGTLYDDLLNSSHIEFRLKMRKMFPDSFNGFDPENEGDCYELRHYIDRSERLSGFGSFKPETYAPSKTKEYLIKLRDNLRELDPERYNKEVADLGAYELVKRYDTLHKGFSAR